MEKEKFDVKEKKLLEDWNIEFCHGFNNGPAFKAYNAFIAEKKRKQEEESMA